jgi:hypothetical protein
MNARPNTICRMVGLADEYAENNGRLVHTHHWCASCRKWHATALETVVAGQELDSYAILVSLAPPGTTLGVFDENLRPLGDSGPEEGDLFGLPTPAKEKDHAR